MSEKRSSNKETKNPRSETPLSRSLSTFLRSNNKRYPSMTAFAEKVGLSRHTIMQICDGRQSYLANRTRSAIFAATGLEEFAPFAEPSVNGAVPAATSQRDAQFATELGRIRASTEAIAQSLARLQSASMEDLAVPQRSPPGLSAAQHVERVRQVLTALDQELAFFKTVEKDQARELLRSRIDPRDIGYIIALLRALYSKEAFENWVLASGYGLRNNADGE